MEVLYAMSAWKVLVLVLTTFRIVKLELTGRLAISFSV